MEQTSSDPLQSLGRALTSLRESLDAWAALLDKGGTFDHPGVKRSWDDLFTRTRAVEQLAADLDRGQGAFKRDLKLLVADVGHLHRAWASGLEYLGSLLPDSPPAKALRDCAKRAKELEAAPSDLPSLRDEWVAAVARLTQLVEETVVILKTPPNIDVVQRENDRRDAAAAAAAGDLEAARTERVRLESELKRSAEAVASLEAQVSTLSNKLLDEAQVKLRLLAESSEAGKGKKTAEDLAKSRERAADERIKALEKTVKDQADSLEKASSEKDRLTADLKAQLSTAKEQLDRANARISKLTQQIEASLRKG